MTDAMEPTFSTPTEDDVLQADEEPMSSVPVTVENVVRTDEMPTRSGGFYTIALSTSDAQQVLKRDTRRRSALLLTLNSDFYVGNMRGDVLNNSGSARWPAGTPLVLTTADEVWCAAASNTDTMTVIVENWAR